MNKHIHVHITYDCRIICFLFFKSGVRGVENNDDYPIMLQKLWKRSKYNRIDWREKKLSFMPVLPKGESAHGRALFEKHSKELDQGQAFFFVLPIIKTEIILLAWLKFALNLSNNN